MTDYARMAAAVLAKCASKDPFFPKPSAALALGWGEEFECWNLTQDELLAGVTKAYRDNGNGFRPLPKDIVDAARAVRKDKRDRETIAERQAREDERDADYEKAWARITARTGQKTLGRSPEEVS